VGRVNPTGHPVTLSLGNQRSGRQPLGLLKAEYLKLLGDVHVRALLDGHA